MRRRVEDFQGPTQNQSPRIGQETLFLDQIQIALQKPLVERCEHVRKMIEEFSIKDLHLLYPHLLASIFDFSASKGWALHSPCTRSLEGLRHFLGPKGHVFKLVEKLERDSFLRYEFPVTCLSKPTQRLLSEGVVPALYCNKVQFTGASQTPLVISLGAVEYFLFQFSYFITQSSSQLESRSLDRSYDTLYTALFNDYLEFFLPINIALPKPDGFPGGYPRTAGKSTVTRETHYHGSSLFSGLIKSFENKVSPHTPSFDQTSSQMIQSEIFLQIVIEFWLNHTVDKEDNNAFSPFGRDYFLPSVDHVRVVRMLVKHLHLFMNVNMNNHGVMSPSHLNEEYCRNLLPESVKMFKKGLYWFIHHCFAHWPLDPTFRFILETWLSYIQPWRYITPEMNPKRRDGKGTISPNWKPFIRHNLLFYTVLLQEFLNRAVKLNLRSSKDTQLFYRVTKVFSQDPLMSMVNEVEREFISCLSSVQEGFVQRSRSPRSAQYFHFMELQTPGAFYKPLFVEETVNHVRGLIRHIEDIMRSLREPECRDFNSTRDGGWLSRQIKDTINWLQNVFAIDEHYWLIQDENHKAQEHLDHVCKQLRRLFQIQDVEQEKTIGWATEFGDTSSLSCVRSRTDSFETRPDCVETEQGMVLTALGKYQMANGLRRFDIQYSGDPDLQPIRSYEIVFLVRGLYKLSTMVNEKFGPRLSLIYNRSGWSGRLARHLSPAVQEPRTLSPVKHHRPQVTAAPAQPKISLRYLASCRLWAQLFLLTSFMMFVLDRPWLATLAVVFILSFMFVRNIHAIQATEDSRSARSELVSG